MFHHSIRVRTMDAVVAAAQFSCSLDACAAVAMATSHLHAAMFHSASSHQHASWPTAGLSLPRGINRHNLESNLDHQSGRIPLGLIGANPKNRGGQAVIPFHLHKHVLSDIVTNGTHRPRYAPVRLLEVPTHRLLRCLLPRLFYFTGINKVQC